MILDIALILFLVSASCVYNAWMVNRLHEDLKMYIEQRLGQVCSRNLEVK